MATAQIPASFPTLVSVVDRVDQVLFAFLDARRRETGRQGPHAALLVEEILRIVRAGGKRLRPAFCYWGYRAAGGHDGEPIVRAAAALELLHTMALVHDDLIDGTPERRDVPTTVRRFAVEARARSLGSGDAEAFGEAGALLVGDLAAVLADRLLLESGLPADALVRGLAPYHRMRGDMAVGQLLDLAMVAVDPAAARRVAALKGGSYTVEGPLCIGAAFAGGSPLVEAQLRRFGAPLGEAFQLRDDLVDGDATHGATADDVSALVERALASLDVEVLGAEAVDALRTLAGLIAIR